MDNGGRRPGAGRPKGAKTKKSGTKGREIAQRKVTPLDVMEKAMLIHFEAERYDAAAAVAKDMAPYVHAKMSTVKIGGDPANSTPILFVEVAASDASTTDRDSDEE